MVLRFTSGNGFDAADGSVKQASALNRHTGRVHPVQYTTGHPMKMKFSSRIFAAAGVVALAAVGTAAQAHVNVSVGVGLPLFAPAPVYVQPQPVYVQPQAVYVQPQPVYVQAQPVYAAPPALSIYYGPGYHRGWRHGHRHWH
jgi:hypothetical protein